MVYYLVGIVYKEDTDDGSHEGQFVQGQEVTNNSILPPADLFLLQRIFNFAFFSFRFDGSEAFLFVEHSDLIGIGFEA